MGSRSRLRPTPAGEEVVRIRGDRDDVFSQGYICPKGSTLKQLHEDPDRLRRPVVKRDGAFVEVSWDEAFAEIERRLLPLLDEHGRDACAIYVGNPNAHNLAGLLYNRALLRALGSTNVFSASTVDQRPKEISSALMFGGGLNVPVPDVDRTDHLLMLGANPFASNGSLATAPDWPGRIERAGGAGRRGRGGRPPSVAHRRGGDRVGADPPRRRRLPPDGDGAGDHQRRARRPRPVRRSGHRARRRRGRGRSLHAGGSWPTPPASRPTTSDAWHASSPPRPTACVYGRIGTTTAEFGTLTSWLVDVLNVLTGNLDRPGGAMFTTAAAGASNTRGKPRYGRAVKLHRRTSRVRELPETFGELPAVAMAEEMDTPGEGQIRALVTVAGNPVLSTPNSARLDAAIAGLDFRVAIDIYVNETTRHADVILPAPSPLQKGHYDLALLQLALHDTSNYSEPVLPLDADQPTEWEVLARLALVLQGAGTTADPALVDDLMITSMVQGSVADETSPIHGRDVDEILEELGPRRGPERILDFLLRTGPYGEGFGGDPDGSSLDKLLANPHGVDHGAAEAAPPRRAPHARRDDRPGAGDPPRRRRHGCTRGSMVGGTTRSCSSGGGTSGRTTRGCTTCRCW